MAKFTYDCGTVEAQLSKLEEAMHGRIVKKALQAGADVIMEKWRSSGERAGYAYPGKTGRGTGDLLESITAGAPIHNSITVKPDGKHGKSRAGEVAFVLNYGRTNMPGSAWITTANEEAEEGALSAMEETFANLLNNL